MITMDIVQKRMRKFISGGSAERMGYLRDRWLDEREHENWADYVAEFKKLVPEGFKFERAVKSPFGFTMTAAGIPGAFQVTATTRAVNVKLIRV